jgi:putative protein-disulfide isomerase
LLQAAASIAELRIELHGGGMMAGPRRQAVTESLRGFVIQHDHRIAEMSGQPFGTAYVDGLLRDTGAVFDSESPITAIVAAGAFGKSVEMLDRIQRAHFVEGQRITETNILENLAQEIGIDRAAFANEFAAASGARTQQHIEDSRAFLYQAGGAGFPTFVLETDAEMKVMTHGTYLGRAAEWRKALAAKLAGRVSASTP